MATDLPGLDESVVRLPSDMREDLAERGKRDLFFLCKGVLGMRDLTPVCHMPLASFIDENPAQMKICLMPRDHFKTSVVTIGGTIQRVLRNPNERCLIANESATNAQRMLRAIRQHAESNKVFRALYSDLIPKSTTAWNNEELIFNREWLGPEPTIDTVGMTGAFTSRHYTYITADDLISEEAIKSEKVMQDTIDRFSRFMSLLVNPTIDPIVLVGTRWGMHDIYSFAMKGWGSRAAIFVRSVIENDEFIFPERMNHDILGIKRQMYGDYLTSCLYYNNPKADNETGLNVQDLGWWEWNSDETRILLYTNRGASRVEVESVDPATLDITTTVDPAPAETAASDRNAIVTVGVTDSGRAIVLDAWARRCQPMELIEYLFELHKRWHPRAFGIEDVAYQKVLKWFVRTEADRRGLYLNVVPVKPSDRHKRHIRGLQPIMATGRLFIHPAMSGLRQELYEYPTGQHDDIADALGLQQQLWRGIMSPERWAQYKQHEAELVAAALGRPVSAGEGTLVTRIGELWRDPEWKKLYSTREVTIQ